MTDKQTETRKSKRGFASMDREKRRLIASKGGKRAHELGRAHQFSVDEARAAGRKGGEVVAQNRALMSRIGRLGAEKRHSARRQGQTTAKSVSE